MKCCTALAVVFCATFASVVATPTSGQETGAPVAALATPAVHEAYTAAINSNDLEKLLAIMTDDVVFMAPNSAPIIGKTAVRPWLEGYIAAYKTYWDKKAVEFVVAGEWAFERYSYTSTDTPRDGGDPIVDTGWGLVIYHHDADGVWRVARDAWGSDRPAAE